MAVTVPNIEDSPSYDAMAVRDSADLFALSCDAQGTGVISGMSVTGPSVMAVNIASGSVVVAGTTYSYTAGSVAVGAASTSDRRDSVVYLVGTGASVIAGQPCGYTTGNWNQNVTTNSPPVKPTMPANSVLLAEVYVAGSGGTATTSITSTNLVDKRNVLSFAAVLASPVMTGVPTAPTAAFSDNSTQVATDAFVHAYGLTPTATKTSASVTAVAGDFVMCDATSNAIQVNAPALVAGVRWGVRLTTAVANAVTLYTGTGTFDSTGTSTLTMASGTGTQFVDVSFAANSAGTQWVSTTSGKPNAYLATLFGPVAATNLFLNANFR